MSNLNQSLDEIISSGKQQRRKGGFRNRKGAAPYKTTPSAQGKGSKISVTNLHFNVTEADLKELFSKVGKVKRATLNFDQNGRSRGTAEVLFLDGGDASKAQKKYDKVTLDGRPMNIEAVGDSSKGSSINDRLSNNGKNSGGNERRGGGRGGRGGRGRGRGKDERPTKTANELDEEMASYMKGAGQEVTMTDA